MDNIRYCWLNIQDGTFSNSWNEKEHKWLLDKDGNLEERYFKENKWKLIKYECVNFPNFEINNHMKLR